MTLPRSQSAGRADSTRATQRLLLFVAGDEPNSRIAKENLARLLEPVAEQRCEVQIIDVFEDHRAAVEHAVLVTPCLLLADLARPVRVFGNLSNLARVRSVLRLASE